MIRIIIKNKEERYSRVPRLSDTRYSAIWRYASRKAIWALEWFLDQSIGIDETNTFQLKFFI